MEYSHKFSLANDCKRIQNKKRGASIMISYTALILGIVGTIWTIFIIATIVTRKKKKKSKKKLLESLLPFASRTYPRESLEYSFAHAL